MENRSGVPAIAGAIVATLILLYLGSVMLLSNSGEPVVNHAIAFIVVSFLALIGYEDWKDAQRERQNRSGSGHLCRRFNRG
ncbi:MAG: hypothetical protein RQ736_02115 [Thiogranum sp.]|nr:hypothetical protein [Thiogranum sp.]